jgi:hypothetical protein
MFEFIFVISVFVLVAVLIVYFALVKIPERDAAWQKAQDDRNAILISHCKDDLFYAENFDDCRRLGFK